MTRRRFATGGGVHAFANFDREDDGRIMTVREAFRKSVNLVFIRLMRQRAAPDNVDNENGAGLGLINVFDANGNLVKHLVATGGVLNAPWGLALAPSDFGTLSGALLVGNFGDGRINAFDPSGTWLGTLNDTNGYPLTIDGLERAMRSLSR